jgi:PAS domain S-box-containing protein
MGVKLAQDKHVSWHLSVKALIALSLLLFHAFPTRLLAGDQQAKLEPVSIQLKWSHAFQFAGYYAAIEKGYYRAEGLDVSLIEADITKDIIDDVAKGRANYGISDSTLLIYHMKGYPVVLVNQFFQHSPLVFISHRDSGIISPYEMAGKSVSYNYRTFWDAPLNAMLLKTLGDMSKIKSVKFTPEVFQSFLNRKLDVISAYLTSQPFVLKQKGVEVNIINPQNYGIDFYGDNLYTSQKELQGHPERIAKVSRATIKGWEYALEHTGEIIDLIQKKYSNKLSKEALEYEANSTKQLFVKDFIPIGSVDPARYRLAAETYHQLKLTSTLKVDDSFFYNLKATNNQVTVSFTAEEKAWIQSHPAIRYGVETDWAPFDFVDKAGKPTGYASDLLVLISKYSGLNFEPEIDKWDNLQAKIKAKKIDLLPPDLYSEERNSHLIYTEPYERLINYFFIHEEVPAKTMQDLDGKTVAIPKGYPQIEEVKKNYPKLKVLETDGLMAAVEAVLERKADILLETYPVMHYALKTNNINAIRPFKPLPYNELWNLRMSIRKDLPSLLSILNKTLVAIPEQERQQLREKWLGDQATQVDKTVQLTTAEQKWIREHPVVKYAAETDWAPFDFVDKDGKPSGYTQDLLALISKYSSLNFTPEIDQWDNLVTKVKTKKIDILPAEFANETNKPYMDFTESYERVIPYFFVHEEVSANTMQDLNGKTVAIPKGYAQINDLKKDYSKLKILETTDLMAAVQAVIERKADILLDSYAVLRYVLKENNINSIRPFKAMPYNEIWNLRMAVRKDWPALLSILNKTLAAIPDQERQQLRGKWLGDQATQNDKTVQLTTAEQKWIREHPVVKYGAETDWPPFDFVDQAGEHTGLCRDLLLLIGKYSGLKFEATTDTWNALLEQTKAKNIDLLPSLFDTEERRSYLAFTDSYQLALEYFFVHESAQIKTLADLDGKTIAVTKGYAQIEAIKQHFPKLKIMETNDLMASVHAVIERKADVLLEIYSVMNYLLKQNSIASIKPFSVLPPGKAKELKMAVRKDLPILYSVIQKTMAALPQKEKQEIYDKWLGSQENKAEDRFEISPAEKKWLTEHPVIRFVGDPNWLPYEAFDSKGRYIGMVSDYLKLIENKLHIKFDILPTKTWSESIIKIRRNEADAVSETNDSDLRPLLEFTQAYLSSPIVIVMRDHETYVDNIEQIKNHRIAVIKDYDPIFKRRYPNIKFHEFVTLQEGLTAVSIGKVDALLSALAPANYYISSMGIDNVRIVGKTEIVSNLGLGIRKELAPLAPIINRALNSISEVEKQQISDQWGKDRFAFKTDYELIAKILGAVFILFLLTLIWIRTIQRQKDKLRISEERFEMAMNATSDGLWDWNRSSDIMFYSPRWMTMLGYEPLETFYELLHPDDRERINTEIEAFIEQFSVNYEQEFRLRTKDGSYRWILSRGRVFLSDKIGRALRAVGTHTDITERKQTDEQFKTLINALPVSVGVFDSKRKVLLRNSQFELELGGKQGLSNRTINTFFTDPTVFDEINRTLSQGFSIIGKQVSLLIDTDKTIDCLISVIPVQFQGHTAYLVAIVDLSDRIRIEKELALAKEAAERASHFKSEFLANMSHEIRTPLNAIIGFTDLLTEQVKDNKQKSFVKTIQSAGQNLLVLINDILDLSKIEAGKMRIEKRTCNPASLFNDLAQIFMITIKERDLDFILDIDPKIPDNLVLDAPRLRQVLFNLIGNAVKFTHEGHIRLRVRTDNKDWGGSKLDLYIDVEDSGIGIEEKQQELIFRDFEQVEGQDARKYGGTGLGLAISKRLTELMGGKISLTSKLGVGSTFTVHLIDIAISSLSLEAELINPTKQIDFHPANVLVVDDIENNRDLLRECFATTKLTISEVANGLEAVNKVQAGGIDLVLMDIRMPVMNGYEAAEKIKAFSTVPIVALTASVMHDEYENAKSIHFDGYLRKPVLKNELVAELSRFLAFEEKDIVIEAPKKQLVLTPKELQTLPYAIKELEKQVAVVEQISKSNNISEINKFAATVLAIGKKHDITVLKDYAISLRESVDIFDISAIKSALDTYLELIDQLMGIDK